MSVLTIREKNQVTIPRHVLEKAGLAQGDAIEFEALPDGGIGVYPYGRQKKQESLWDLAVRLAQAIPGLEDCDLELPSREMDLREVEL